MLKTRLVFMAGDFIDTKTSQAALLPGSNVGLYILGVFCANFKAKRKRQKAENKNGEFCWEASQNGENTHLGHFHGLFRDLGRSVFNLSQFSLFSFAVQADSVHYVEGFKPYFAKLYCFFNRVHSLYYKQTRRLELF